LGANPWRVFRHITLPLIRPGLISAALFAFIVSFDDLTIALFVTGGLYTTLPRKMWDEMLLQVSPTLAAVSTILVGIVTAVLFAIEFARRRSARRTGA
ncbi:MAG: ABC transporter permease subunit, partial [Thermomicrobiales bacterium]|nr:ABC transporter permease subunit [Thermomicrobiales bacterium]